MCHASVTGSSARGEIAHILAEMHFHNMCVVSRHLSETTFIALTVSACKGAGIWPLDSQLETEIHSFSQSPPPGVSKYHRGPFDQRPQGPWRRSQSFDLHFGSFFANFQSAVALSVSCWDGSFSVWSHQTWPTRRPILKNWAIWKFLLINLFQLSFSQKRDNGGVPPTLLRCPSAFWVSFGPLETNSLSSGWSLQKWPPFWAFFVQKIKFSHLY